MGFIFLDEVGSNPIAFVGVQPLFDNPPLRYAPLRYFGVIHLNRYFQIESECRYLNVLSR